MTPPPAIQTALGGSAVNVYYDADRRYDVTLRFDARFRDQVDDIAHLPVALPEGLYLYDPHAHALQRTVAADARRVTGYQDFVDSAPLDLVYVADHARMKLVPAEQRSTYAAAAAGAMAQNVYLQAASAGLATVIRAWLDRPALAQAMGLGTNQQVLLAQTVGWPAGAAPQ